GERLHSCSPTALAAQPAGPASTSPATMNRAMRAVRIMRSLLALVHKQPLWGDAMAPIVQTEREPNQEKSPPRRPVKEMQRMSPWVSKCAPPDWRKTPVLSPADPVILLHCQLFKAKAQFLTRIDPVSMVRATLGAKLSWSCLNRRGCRKHGRRRTRER